MSRSTTPSHDHLDAFTLDAALDAWAQGDRTALTALDADSSAAFGLLQEWATLGGHTTAQPHTTPILRGHRANRDGLSSTPERTPEMFSPLAALPYAPASAAQPPRWRASWNVIAWVLIVALAGGAIWWTVPLLRDNPADPTPPLAGIVQSEATPEAVAEGTEINYGGDAGKSWVVGQADPDLENTVYFVPFLSDSPEMKWAGLPLIVGDSALAMVFDLPEPQMLRYDLVTNTILWTQPYAFSSTITASDGTLWFGSRQIDGNMSVPAAVSVETGEMVWTAPTHPRAAEFMPLYPVVSGDVVYYYDNLGNVLALDRTTGDLLWQYPEASATDTVFNDFDETLPPPQTDLVVTAHGLFVLMPSKTILQLDASTGEVIDDINVIDTFGNDIANVWLQSNGDHLIVQASRSATGAGTGAQRPDAMPVSILIFDTATFDLVGQSALSDVNSNLVVTADTIYAIGRVATNDQLLLVSITMTGEVTAEPWVDVHYSQLVPWISLSLSGNYLMLVSSNGESTILNLNGDIEDARSFTPNDEALPMPAGPMLMWGDRAVLYLTTWPAPDSTPEA